LDQNDFIVKIKAFFYAFRHGQTEKVLATLAVMFFGGASYLRLEWKELPRATYLAYLAYALGAACMIWLVLRIWKLATPPPEPPAGPVPSAIKGLFPFTITDGKLFAQLGRQMELQQLLGLARNDGIAISAVRGESGAGKTSLLQAGLAYTLGEQQCVYWEAVPENVPDALLYAIRSQLPEIESLESLPQACPRRCVLILDQFEQLRTEELGHASVFTLLTRIAKAPAPHKLSVIVGFRREYAADWLDFEKDSNFRAEQVPINLLASRTAADALVTLAGEASFTLDQALVENFISSVARTQGVLPVDIAIGVLTLANFVQQRGVTHVGMKEYGLAGGAQGLLLSFVQQKLEEIPEDVRAPLLKGIALALISPSNNQRVAAGDTVAAIASKAETSEKALAPWLERLAHPRVRLLEKLEKKTAAVRYRLPHERLVPVLRRLAGGTLASLDQLRLRFEGEYARWREGGDSRHFIRGKDLRNVLRHSEQFVQGETAPAKTQYLAACVRRRVFIRLAIGAAVVAMAGIGYASYRAWDSSIQHANLKSWGLPPGLLRMQHDIDGLEIARHPVNDLAWLKSTRIKKLGLLFTGSRLTGLEQLKGLTSLTFNLSGSEVTSLAGLEQLKGLTSLTLNLSDSEVTSLAGLEQLKGLTSLTLNPGGSPVTSLEGLEQLKGLTSLALDLRGSKVTSFGGVGQLKGLTSLTLDLFNSKVTSLAGLEQLKGLTSLTLNVSGSPVTSLRELEQLKGLTSLTLNLFNSPVTSLEGLEQLKGLTSLTLNLGASQVTSLGGLEQLKGLTTLTLDLFNSTITSLKGLEQLKGLTSLTLNLGASKVTSLAGLEQLKGLTTLTLNLGASKVTSLGELEQLKRLISLNMSLPASLVTSFSRSKIRCDITHLWIVIDANSSFEVPAGCNFVGIGAFASD
jgi:hypothetical protein